ncbi:MAG: hypothetical protein ACLP1Y_14115 [Candidatus Acidiferrales bacterium]
MKRVIFLGILAALGILLYVRADTPRTMPLLHHPAVPQDSSLATRGYAQRVSPMRRIYGHSIVPGGIHSVEELKRAIVADPLAAQHYAGFDVTKAYITKLPHDELVFLSYRLNHHIYFTSVLRLIRAGEEVLTDGDSYILTRCGNRIAFSFQPNVNITQEPTDLDLYVAELPALPAFAPPLIPVATPPAAVPPGAPASPPSASSVTSAAPSAPDGDGGGAPSSVFLPPALGAGSSAGGTPTQISGDDMDTPTEVTLLICGLAAILAWRFLTR